MNYLDIQIVTESNDYPEAGLFQQWVDAALADAGRDIEIVIRLVDETESAELNRQYRHKSGATNILSFPFSAPPGAETDLLGDLVLCCPLIRREALAQHKPVAHHWAHITIHGVLHLLGYDHCEELQAEQMETLEIEILSKLNIANPYLEESAP
ncbi:MAG: rRNA maturation RNase YbeY [Methylomonas sp.]|jgi:probable rRNA maturation factor